MYAVCIIYKQPAILLLTSDTPIAIDHATNRPTSATETDGSTTAMQTCTGVYNIHHIQTSEQVKKDRENRLSVFLVRCTKKTKNEGIEIQGNKDSVLRRLIEMQRQFFDTASIVCVVVLFGQVRSKGTSLSKLYQSESRRGNRNG